jgi:hypothetical protein
VWAPGVHVGADVLSSSSHKSIVKTAFQSHSNRYKRLIVFHWSDVKAVPYDSQQRTNDIVPRLAALDALVWKNIATISTVDPQISERRHCFVRSKRFAEHVLYNALANLAVTIGIGTTMVGVGMGEYEQSHEHNVQLDADACATDYVGELGLEISRLPQCNCLCVQRSRNLEPVLALELSYLVTNLRNLWCCAHLLSVWESDSACRRRCTHRNPIAAVSNAGCSRLCSYDSESSDHEYPH